MRSGEGREGSLEELLATGGAGRPLTRVGRLACWADCVPYRVGHDTSLQGGLVGGEEGVREVRGVREGIVRVNVTVDVSQVLPDVTT